MKIEKIKTINLVMNEQLWLLLPTRENPVVPRDFNSSVRGRDLPEINS